MHDTLKHVYIDGEYYNEDTLGPFYLDCAFCRGTGVHPDTMGCLNHSFCPVCYGEGRNDLTGYRYHVHLCDGCSGSGMDTKCDFLEICPDCGGLGVLGIKCW